ncbi:type II secretion system F family protein [Kiloniella litopenaei]|uniref:type II secretion system F family protein n=1 Tax=Kiloniella litopenaei TaxID=1549748 RepID=UPI003BACBA8A
MLRFSFNAVDGEGKQQKGYLDAENEARVVEHLRAQGFFPVEIREDKTGRQSVTANTRLRGKKKIPLADLRDFTKSFGFLLSSGVDIPTSLKLLVDTGESAKSPLVQAIERSIDRIRKGESLSASLLKADIEFPGFYISMLKAGELVGDLAQSAKLLSDYLDLTVKNREKIKSALIYPAILSAVAFSTLIFFCIFVIPSFRPFLETSGAELPFFTEIFLWIGDVMSNYGMYLLVFIMALILISIRFFATPRGKEVLSTFLLGLPVIGRLIEKSEIARFCRTTGALLHGGLPLLEAVTNACDVVQSTSLRLKLSSAKEELRRGRKFSDILIKLGGMPNIVIELTKVGEATGRLAYLLQDTAGLIEEDVQRKAERLTSLLGPGITVVIGLGIGLFVISVILAIYSANDAIFL